MEVIISAHKLLRNGAFCLFGVMEWLWSVVLGLEGSRF